LECREKKNVPKVLVGAEAQIPFFEQNKTRTFFFEKCAFQLRWSSIETQIFYFSHGR